MISNTMAHIFHRRVLRTALLISGLASGVAVSAPAPDALVTASPGASAAVTAPVATPESVARALAITKQAAAVRVSRELQASAEAVTRQAVAAAFQEATSWFSTVMVPVGIGLLIYVLLMAVVRRQNRRLRRQAKEIRGKIEPADESRLAEAQEAISGDPEKQAELERRRERQQRKRAALERRARGLELRAKLNNTIGGWLLTVALILYFVWLFFEKRGFESVRPLLTPLVLQVIAATAIKIFLIILAVNLLRLMTRVLTNRIFERVSDHDDSTMTERELRAQTLVNVINGTVTVFLYLIAGFMIIQQLGLPIMPLLTGAGIAGIAIGFGAQTLVRDFLTGFFILLENQYRVGDVINIGGTGGLVERITLRATYLRDLSGSLHIIPNGQINSVTNMTFSWSRYVVNMGVSYDSDPDHVIRVLREVGVKMRREEPWSKMMMEDPEILGLDQFGDSALVFKVLLKTRPLKQWAVGREYNRRLKYAFDAEGIEIPFPQRVVHMRSVEEASGERPAELPADHRD